MEIPEMLVAPPRFLRLCVDIVCEFVYYFIHSAHTSLPPMSSPLLLDSGTVLARKILDRKARLEIVKSG